MYTMFPVFSLVLDKDVSSNIAMTYPELYKEMTKVLLKKDKVWIEVIVKEGNVLFNDALKTFYLQLYDIRHMIKDNSDSKRGMSLPPLHGLLFLISSMVLWLVPASAPQLV